MSEKRFLNCLMAEGILLLVLGICIIVLPKLTALSYGVMIAAAFITYGLYRIFNTFMKKNRGFSMIYGIIIGIYLLTIGVLILLVPNVSLLWLIAFIGIYFIVDGISSAVYSYYIRGRYGFWGSKLFAAIILMLAGIIILLGMPLMSFWMVTMLSGVAFLIKGIAKLTLSLINIPNYKI